MTKAQQLVQALDRFLEVSDQVEAAAVVSADGLPMASALPPHVQEDRLAAMSAALLTLGDRAAEGLGKGDLEQVFVEGATGYVILMSAGHGAVLVSVTSREAKVGLILFEMRKTATEVRAIMASDTGSTQFEQPPAHEQSPAPSAYEPPAPQEQQPYPAEAPSADVISHPTVSAWE